jgi:drug/metabolite transporter (DMT)-like permease
MHPPPPSWKIGLALILGMFALATGALLVRLANQAAMPTPPGFSLVIAGSRMGLAALLLAPQWRHFKATNRRAIDFAIAAGMALALHFGVWITSLSYTTIIASTVLVTTTPIWTALGTWLIGRERMGKPMLLGIAIAFLGGLIISYDMIISDDTNSPQLTASNPLLGNALATLGAIAATVYLLFGQSAQKAGLTTRDYILISYTTAAVILMPLSLLAGGQYVGYPPITYLWFVLMAIVPQILGHSSFNWAMRFIGPLWVTLAILAEPIGASILGYFILKETPGIQTIQGGAILLIGIAISTRTRKP